jgi:hypothetical protein
MCIHRQVANAEILSMSLQMEDVLLSGVVERSAYLNIDEVEPDQRRRKVSTSKAPSAVVNKLSTGIGCKSEFLECYTCFYYTSSTCNVLIFSLACSFQLLLDNVSAALRCIFVFKLTYRYELVHCEH